MGHAKMISENFMKSSFYVIDKGIMMVMIPGKNKLHHARGNAFLGCYHLVVHGMYVVSLSMPLLFM
jgi:hypothetical protein